MKEEQKKYSPWVNILKKHDSKEDAKASKDKDAKPLWSPPPIPESKDEKKEEALSEQDKALVEKLDEHPSERETIYWKLHKEYYNAHLDILSAEDREMVTRQPGSPQGVDFNRKVKRDVNKAVDYQMTFLN